MRRIKKYIALSLVFLMMIGLCSCVSISGSEESGDSAKTIKIGVLTMLNMTVDEVENVIVARGIADKQLIKEGYCSSPNKNLQEGSGLDDFNVEVVYYDNLESMMMALEAGEINGMQVYYRTAQYICQNNYKLQLGVEYHFEKEPNEFVDKIMQGVLGNNFAFLLMRGNEALKYDMDDAIKAMKNDGTMDQLIQTYLEDAVNGTEPEPVKMPVIDGAETIKVGVTGALPPMDYITADGVPAGYNTAVLAEISKRIGKNIELVQIDSGARSTALSSGTVDVVFWTRTNDLFYEVSEMSEDERAKDMEQYQASMTEEEHDVLKQIRGKIDFSHYAYADMPADTICTVSYYGDICVPVIKK